MFWNQWSCNPAFVQDSDLLKLYFQTLSVIKIVVFEHQMCVASNYNGNILKLAAANDLKRNKILSFIKIRPFSC